MAGYSAVWLRFIYSVLTVSVLRICFYRFVKNILIYAKTLETFQFNVLISVSVDNDGHVF